MDTKSIYLYRGRTRKWNIDIDIISKYRAKYRYNIAHLINIQRGREGGI